MSLKDEFKELDQGERDDLKEFHQGERNLWEIKALEIYRSIYPDRDFEDENVRFPTDVEEIESDKWSTDADIISVEKYSIIGCEVKASTNRLDKGFDQVGKIHRVGEDKGFDVDYRLLVMDDDVLTLQQAVKDLEPVFKMEELEKYDENFRKSNFKHSNVIPSFRMLDREKISEREQIPRYDFEMLHAQKYIEERYDGGYQLTDKGRYLADDDDIWVHLTPRFDYLCHPDQLRK